MRVAAERYRAHVGRDGLTFGLRPEHLPEDRGNGGAHAGAIDAVIEVAEPLGMETLIFFRINEVEVCGRVSPTAGAREGTRLRLCAGLDNMHLIDEASGHVI